MMMQTEYEVETLFRGSRFEQKGIPPIVHRDLPVWHKIAHELVKQSYRQDNPDRKNVPFHVQNDFDLTIETARWSNRVIIVARPTAHSEPYVQKGLDSFMEVLHQDSIAFHPAVMQHVTRLYSHLDATEAIEMSTKNHPEPAPLTKSKVEEMSRAIRASATISGDVSIRGIVYEVDRAKSTFEIEINSGGRLKDVPIPKDHVNIVLEAFSQYETGSLLRLDGVTTHEDGGRKVVDNVQSIMLLDPLDVPARLDEFRKLRNGWRKKWYLAPDHHGLDWFASSFVQHYPPGLPLPYVFPTPKGGIEAEWIVGDDRVIFEIDITNRTGDWLQWNKQSDQEEERTIDLNMDAGWADFIDKISQLVNNE